MTGNRIWMIGAALAIVGIVLLGWFLGVSPKLAEARSANEQRTTVEAQNALQEATLDRLREQFDNLPAIEADIEALRPELPEAHELDLFIDSIDAAAERAGVIVDLIQSAEAGPIPPPADATEPVDGGPTSGAEVYSVQVTITVKGTAEQAIEFSRIVQEGERLFFAPMFNYTEAGQPTGTLTGYVFVVRGQQPAAEDTSTETDAAP